MKSWPVTPPDPEEAGIAVPQVGTCTGDMGFAGLPKPTDLKGSRPRDLVLLQLRSFPGTSHAGALLKDAQGKKGRLHTLNGPVRRAGRSVAARNYQQADGSVAVPAVLRPLHGRAGS